MGQAARNVNGKVVMFHKKITNSMKSDFRNNPKTGENTKMSITKSMALPHTQLVQKHEDSLRTEDSAEILRASKKMEKMPASERAKIIKELRRNARCRSKTGNLKKLPPCVMR